MLRLSQRFNICGCGGTGRRARLRGVWATVWVQVPSAAPLKELVIASSFFLLYKVRYII